MSFQNLRGSLLRLSGDSLWESPITPFATRSVGTSPWSKRQTINSIIRYRRFDFLRSTAWTANNSKPIAFKTANERSYFLLLVLLQVVLSSSAYRLRFRPVHLGTEGRASSSRKTTQMRGRCPPPPFSHFIVKVTLPRTTMQFGVQSMNLSRREPISFEPVGGVLDVCRFG